MQERDAWLESKPHLKRLWWTQYSLKASLKRNRYRKSFRVLVDFRCQAALWMPSALGVRLVRLPPNAANAKSSMSDNTRRMRTSTLFDFRKCNVGTAKMILYATLTTVAPHDTHVGYAGPGFEAAGMLLPLLPCSPPSFLAQSVAGPFARAQGSLVNCTNIEHDQSWRQTRFYQC